jgi:hypothetical protein
MVEQVMQTGDLHIDNGEQFRAIYMPIKTSTMSLG